MNQVPSRQQNRRSARFIAVLAISAAVLITGTAGYASVKAEAVGTATSSIYLVNGLEGPLSASSASASSGIDATSEIHRQAHKFLGLPDNF